MSRNPPSSPRKPPDGRWQDLPPTAAQLHALGAIGAKTGIVYPQPRTRGEASDLIDKLSRRNRRRKRGRRAPNPYLVAAPTAAQMRLIRDLADKLSVPVPKVKSRSGASAAIINLKGRQPQA